jgi:predicted permease
MLYNYFKMAIRSLLRHRFYTLLNMAGLAVGIACALLIWVFVQYQQSFDTFHSQKDHLYRVVTEQRFPDGNGHSTGVPRPFPDALKTDFPQMKVAKLMSIGGGAVTIPQTGKQQAARLFKEDGGIFCLEPTFFKLFDFSFLEGNAASLSEPNQVVITQAIAEKYFGNWRAAMGKLVQLEDKTLQVSGILRNPPANTNFPLKIMVSFATFKPSDKGWDGVDDGFQCYVALPENLSAARFNEQLGAFHQKHYPEQTINYQHLQPLADMHFSQQYGTFTGNTIPRTTLHLFLGIGVFLIAMACVNFVNLATAQSVKRSKEIGVRKVLGGNRWQLFCQLLSETALIVVAAILLAVGLAYLGLPWLSKLFSLPESLSLFTPEILYFLLLIWVVVTLLAGSYPALVVSGFQPVTALKSSVSNVTGGGIVLRRVLVVVQFGIAQVLIVGTILVVNQMSFIRNYDVGFQKETVVFLRLDDNRLNRSRQEAFKAELLQHPGIVAASYSMALPTDSRNSSWSIEQLDHKSLSTYLEPQLKYADTAYFRTYGLQLLAGRKYQASDTMHEAMVNETFLAKIGITDPQQVLGKTIKFYGAPGLPIVGVIKDFHNNSLHGEISPIVMSTNAERYQTLSLKVSQENFPKTLAFIQQRWQKFFPEIVFDYQFVDERLAQNYEQEEKLLWLFKVFAGVSVFISCLGILGLMAFTAQQRTKEIGVRKVLGASVASIVNLLSIDFLKLVLLANVIAWPLAWWAMHQWLQNFTYRTPISWELFAMAGLTALFIALATVSYQAIKAAVANPVKSLRSE